MLITTYRNEAVAAALLGAFLSRNQLADPYSHKGHQILEGIPSGGKDQEYGSMLRQSSVYNSASMVSRNRSRYWVIPRVEACFITMLRRTKLSQNLGGIVLN